MPYAIVAFGFLLFVLVIPPLLLLLYPLIFKILGLCNLSETPTVRVLWRVMPIQFLDAFQSSFKDKYCFFAGLYFLYRGTILAFYVTTQTWLEFYAIDCHPDYPCRSSAPQTEKAQHHRLSSLCKPVSHQCHHSLLLQQDRVSASVQV